MPTENMKETQQVMSETLPQHDIDCSSSSTMVAENLIKTQEIILDNNYVCSSVLKARTASRCEGTFNTHESESPISPTAKTADAIFVNKVVPLLCLLDNLNFVISLKQRDFYHSDDKLLSLLTYGTHTLFSQLILFHFSTSYYIR